MSKVVCVVDDQPSLRQMLRFALSFQGLDVVEAENGLDALAQLAKHDIDMLIVDWQMPEMDGLELVRHLRATDEYAEMPIVLVSCRDDLDARKKARSLGVLTWLKKPFRISEIQVVVENALSLNTLPIKQNVASVATGYC